jgi:arylformamidase
MVHWPGDPPPLMDRLLDMDAGDVCNARFLHMSAHSGTHMDAPLHFIRDGTSIDQMPVEATVGRARVIEIRDPEVIAKNELEGCNIQPGERLLFKTSNSANCWKCRYFLKRFVHVNAEGARYLVERAVKTIGVDYLSVGGYESDGVETHQILLGAGVWIIEGLDLSAVGPGSYELLCLPLKVAGGDGAPARAFLRNVSHVK